MDAIVVQGGRRLDGEVTVSGAKNSVLKLMAASLLAPGTFTLRNVPAITDVATMSDLLAAMGVVATSPEPEVLVLASPDAIVPEAPYELVERIRASILVLGPLLAVCGEARVSLPGGDDFGARPIDLHLKGLEAMGARFELSHGYLEGRTDGLHAADITLEFPSVGATENILMAAVLAKGTTVLDNAAREPEIGDLCTMLNAMGADIEGVGSPTLTIHGVERTALRPVSHRVVPDRVEAATYVAAACVAGGEVHVREAQAGHMDNFLRKVREIGATVTATASGLLVASSGRLRAVDVQTMPYPGVATDYKPLIATMLSVSDGVGIITENLFAGRFRYVEELVRMGADIRTDGHHMVVRGVGHLSGAQVRAHDIRAGAALVVAGLVAEGTTVVSDAHHLDRGYARMVDKLRGLGAAIERSVDA
ncbi:MAG TPA: UDP-N-acetylglucosamine 1-carboxyvinyltransferase [Acidimicrobiales bacterium]